VGEESLEILLDWYEKNYDKALPNKLQIKRLSDLTSLSKSIIRGWTSQVRKHKLLVIRQEDGTRFLSINPNHKPRTYRKSSKSKVIEKQDEETNKSLNALSINDKLITEEEILNEKDEAKENEFENNTAKKKLLTMT